MNFYGLTTVAAVPGILLFWLMVLPVGRTLVLGEWLRAGRAALAQGATGRARRDWRAWVR